MFRHVVMMRWTDEATDEQKAAVGEALTALPAAIPEIRAYSFGADAGVSQGNAHFVVVADFDDTEGYRTYASHPAHLEVIATHIRPILAQRTAVQYAFA